MAIVIKAFKERFHGMKKYDIGDEYPDKDAKRVRYLVNQGFLEEADLQNELPNAAQFADLTASEQKQILSGLGIEGDDSNAEKREVLYKQFLVRDENTNEDKSEEDEADEVNASDSNNEDAAEDVTVNADSDA